MKKISAAFDGLKFSTSTLEYAINFAAHSKALLSGVFLDDFTYHGYKLFDMIGSEGVSEQKMKQLMDGDKATRQKAADSFQYACIKEHINYVMHHDESFAVQELLKESIYSDLLLLNREETFTHFPQDRPSQFVKDLLADVQCPVLLVPKEYKEIKKIVLLYDGKPSSVFAIKMFDYMFPWLRSLETEVVSVVDPTVYAGLQDNELIQEFINCHFPEAKYTLLHGNAEEKIVEYLHKEEQSTLAVLGAYRRSSVSMWFKTSMADILMKKLDIPLFVAHNK